MKLQTPRVLAATALLAAIIAFAAGCTGYGGGGGNYGGGGMGGGPMPTPMPRPSSTM